MGEILVTRLTERPPVGWYSLLIVVEFVCLTQLAWGFMSFSCFCFCFSNVGLSFF